MNELTTRSTSSDATAIARRFTLSFPVETVEPYGKGLINDTFLVRAGGFSYILQRINGSVFPEPERIMSNLAVLTTHPAGRRQRGLRIPDLIPSQDGAPFVRGDEGAIWRLMELIPNAQSLQQIDDLEQARDVGRILGRFHALFSDLDPARLAVTLPGFHVTPLYLERLMQAVKDREAGYSHEIQQAIAFVAARRKGASVLEDARRQGQIPVRVIHGDPKLDNILFDRTTGRAVSLIDLDTIQPGLVHCDLGDCLRSCCNRGGESAGTGEDARFDLDLCRAILSTYAAETEGILGDVEIGLFYEAIRLIPFELGLRFLTDHLVGDRYFRVTERGQNLWKAGVQLALVADIEDKEPEIRSIIAGCFGQHQNHESAQSKHLAAP